MHAGNGSSKPLNPEQEISAIQYSSSGQLRTDFTDNRDFADLLLKAYGEKVESTKPFKDWRPAVKAYHAAFEELKKRLQGEWRRIFGDGPSRFPWNGHSDGATDLWREDDLRRDMPVALSLWGSGFFGGHICSEKVRYDGYFDSVSYVPNDNNAYVPNNSPAYDNQTVINKGKDVYKAYVLKFFNASSLKQCKKYLEDFFCAPVSDLLFYDASKFEVGQAVFCKEDLLSLLELYADYYSLDSVMVHNRFGDSGRFVEQMRKVGCADDFLRTTRAMVHLMVQCYSHYDERGSECQKWLCSLLDNLDNNYYLMENLHTYCIQSYELLKGFSYFKANYVNSYSNIGGVAYVHSGVNSKSVECEGLLSVFKKSGKNPLPKNTWDKFVEHAEKRYSIHADRLRLGTR